MKNFKKQIVVSIGLLAAFVLWTAAVRQFDVQAAGPLNSMIGFAGLNLFFHRLTGVHLALYHLTDWLSLAPLCVCMAFGLLGLSQWIRRKSLLKVDFSLLILGGFYLAVMSAYALFEILVVNHRPVLVNGVLEASYPSSTTMLVLCVMPTAMMQLRTRIQNKLLRTWTDATVSAFTAFMVIGRLLSGVHWLTDIIGGVLLSAGLVTMYSAVLALPINQK